MLLSHSLSAYHGVGPFFFLQWTPHRLSEQPGHLKALFYGPALRRLILLWSSYGEAETAPRVAAEIISNHHEVFLASPSKTVVASWDLFLGRFQDAIPPSSGNSC